MVSAPDFRKYEAASKVRTPVLNEKTLGIDGDAGKQGLSFDWQQSNRIVIVLHDFGNELGR